MPTKHQAWNAIRSATGVFLAFMGQLLTYLAIGLQATARLLWIVVCVTLKIVGAFVVGFVGGFLIGTILRGAFGGFRQS